ncbi:hypothetical protein [Aureivirga sp. CE67]|uniref:hypothetical protein n=1 Tax=Aureivirga sp. CE67 TaxID=1788983 RepID=UPI001E4027FB|nr:hypothetical protein [Aureivirga sp. CE67]
MIIEDKFVVVFTILSFVIFVSKLYFLTFKKINTALDEKEFKEIVNETKSKLEWKIRSQSKNKVIAESNSSSFFESREIVTIIRKPNYILINSRTTPDNPKIISSYGGNWNNVATFKNEMKKYLKNK